MLGARKRAGRRDAPLGVLKCRTLPSSRNMLTSSTPGMGWTLSFFNAPCSFLSSWAVEGFVFRTILRRTVPLPPRDAHTREWGAAPRAKGGFGRGKRTDPVRRRLRLKLGQFCGVHGVDSRGSGLTSGQARFVNGVLGVDGEKIKVRYKTGTYNAAQRATRRRRFAFLHTLHETHAMSSPAYFVRPATVDDVVRKNSRTIASDPG